MAIHQHLTSAPMSRLAHFPVAFFASVMGLSGLAIAAQKAEHVMALDTGVPPLLAAVAAGCFITLAGFYAAKAILHWHAVCEEFEHPVKLHFFPTISISLILLSIITLEHNRVAAEWLFLAGVPLHFVFTLAVLHYWFNREHFQVVHLSPAWFIPIVGNVLVPISGASLGYVELSWFFFSIGIVFWIALFAIILNRVIFHNPLPERLAPTLFILIAPPAVGFLAYVRLTGTLDAFSRILFHFALFMTVFLLTQGPRLLRLKFFLSWWAYSFPLAAITVASWLMYEKTGNDTFVPLATGLLLILAFAVAGLVARTVLAIARGEICQPE